MKIWLGSFIQEFENFIIILLILYARRFSVAQLVSNQKMAIRKLKASQLGALLISELRPLVGAFSNADNELKRVAISFYYKELKL